MTIPDSRMIAANWVFHTSILSFVFSLLSVPYNASIVAHEHMNIFAYIGIGDTLLRLFIVLYIAYAPWMEDGLITYALLTVAVGVVIQLFYMIYCRSHFIECRSRIHFYKAIFKEMGAFAFWNFIGCTAGLLKEQGVNILLNIFIGPVVNAARVIAVSVNTAIISFSGNFMGALNPQITKSYAVGDYDYMNSLVERGSRFFLHHACVYSSGYARNRVYLTNLVGSLSRIYHKFCSTGSDCQYYRCFVRNVNKSSIIYWLHSKLSACCGWYDDDEFSFVVYMLIIGIIFGSA